MSADLDALRSAVSIASVLRDRGVDLRRDHGRCACPIHRGDNPQAFSYDEQRFHCFRCGAGGDVFALVVALDGCDFRAAIRRVADVAGVAVPNDRHAESARRSTPRHQPRRRAEIAADLDAARQRRAEFEAEWRPHVGSVEPTHIRAIYDYAVADMHCATFEAEIKKTETKADRRFEAAVLQGLG